MSFLLGLLFCFFAVTIILETIVHIKNENEN